MHGVTGFVESAALLVFAAFVLVIVNRVWTPVWMQAVFHWLWACGQVLSCVRPHDAAICTPRARMELEWAPRVGQD